MNKLSQFWQELKRRKVVRVITVYAASAFVILELLSIIIEPLRLPNWTLQFTIVFLCIGFIVAIILSWIYDIHPEEGVVKTVPVRKVKTEDIPKSSNSWKIASYISFVVIVALVVFHIVTANNSTNDRDLLEKSIAVLPFRNDSPDEERMYFINGTMEAILDNLGKIEDLRVPGRTSVEQYRDVSKPIPVIAEEMGVSYILDGSGQKDGNNIRLTVRLLDARNDKQLWSKSYHQEMKDIFLLQSEIAQLVAAEIKAVITPEEKELIEKVPTSNLTAYDFYQRGREEYVKSWIYDQYGPGLENARLFFNQALEHDPEYALAYAGLAMIHFRKYHRSSASGGQYSADYYNSQNLDSMHLLAQRALTFDDQLADAYLAMAMYEHELGNSEKGLELVQNALEVNPNNSQALEVAADIYIDRYDYVNALSYLHRAASLERGVLLPVIYSSLYQVYFLRMGINELGLKYLEKYLSLTGDSMNYFLFRYLEEFQYGNQRKAFDYAKAAYALDSTHDEAIMYMGKAHYDAGRYQEAYTYYSRYYNQLAKKGRLDINDMNRMGHIFWMVGKKDSAAFYFSKMIEHCKRHIEIRSEYGKDFAYYDLAGVYAFLEEKDSAYHYMEGLSRMHTSISYIVDYLGILDPMFASIRNEKRFQDIFKQMESKFEAEHERVRQWLEENDML